MADAEAAALPDDGGGGGDGGAEAIEESGPSAASIALRAGRAAGGASFAKNFVGYYETGNAAPPVKLLDPLDLDVGMAVTHSFHDYAVRRRQQHRLLPFR
jgi:hypothetical protein